MHYYIYHILKSLEFVIKLINCTHYIFINIYVINDFKIANNQLMPRCVIITFAITQISDRNVFKVKNNDLQDV